MSPSPIHHIPPHHRDSARANTPWSQRAELNLIPGVFFSWPHSLRSDLSWFPAAPGTSKQLNEMQLLEQARLNLFV